MSQKAVFGLTLLFATGFVSLGVGRCADAGPTAAKLAEEETNVAVGANVHVSQALADVPHHEVILAADPENAGCLIAGSMVVYEGDERPNTVAYVSRDGGRSWEAALDKKRLFAGDPAVVFGGDNSAYFARLSADKLESEPGAPALPYVDVFRSGDGGRTWSDPVTIPVTADRPYLAADRNSGSPYDGRVYCNSALYVDSLNSGPVLSLGLYTSRDNAQTFGGPFYRPVVPSSVNLINANGVVLSDGAVVMLHFLDHAAARTEYIAQDKPVPPALAAENLCVAVSRDGGESFGTSQRIADFIHTRRSGIPVLAVAPGGAFKDRLYAVWSDTVPNPQRYLTMLAWSADQGTTWSQPVVLSEQPNGTGYDAFMPSIAVNEAGTVGVSWYDTRLVKDASPESGWDVRFRVSLDGGETWLPSVRVTERTTLFTEEMKAKAPEDEYLYYRAPGDTAGLAADADGTFFPLWIDNRTGLRQAWTAAVTVEAKK